MLLKLDVRLEFGLQLNKILQSKKKYNNIELRWGQNPLNCLPLLILYHSCFRSCL